MFFQKTQLKTNEQLKKTEVLSVSQNKVLSLKCKYIYLIRNLFVKIYPLSIAANH